MKASGFMSELGSWLASAGVGLASTLAAKTSEFLVVRTRNERWVAALVQLDRIVASVVRELEQQHVRAVRAASPHAKLGAVTKRLLQNAALALVKQHLGPGGLDELSHALRFDNLTLDDEAVDRFIATRIEAHVFQLRLLGGEMARPRNEGHGVGRS